MLLRHITKKYIKIIIINLKACSHNCRNYHYNTVIWQWFGILYLDQPEFIIVIHHDYSDYYHHSEWPIKCFFTSEISFQNVWTKTSSYYLVITYSLFRSFIGSPWLMSIHSASIESYCDAENLRYRQFMKLYHSC